MLKKLLYGLIIIAAVSALLTMSACGHYTHKAIMAELVWGNWMGA